MISLTAAQLGAVRRAAAAHHVAQLELFGSAARGEAEPHDVDFIVRFQPLPPLEQGRTYLRLVSASAQWTCWWNPASPTGTSSTPSGLNASCCMPLDPRVWLSDVLEAGQLAQQFAAGLTFEQYEADLLRRSAVERQLTILGEAVVQLANLTPSVTFSVPGMIGFRNFLIHRYARVDQTIVWAVLRDDVPVLLTEAQQFLQQLGS